MTIKKILKRSGYSYERINTALKKLEEKNGEAIGFIAKEIVEFSGMGKDVEELEKLKN